MADATSTCNYKHTHYQPPVKAWRCPRCGARPPEFVVDMGPNLGCEKLHDEDEVICGECDSGWSGATVAKLLVKKNGLVKCSCCRGTGYMPKVGPVKK